MAGHFSHTKRLVFPFDLPTLLSCIEFSFELWVFSADVLSLMLENAEDELAEGSDLEDITVFDAFGVASEVWVFDDKLHFVTETEMVVGDFVSTSFLTFFPAQFSFLIGAFDFS